MKILLPLMKQKLDTCKELLLTECVIDKKRASLTEMEAGLLQEILASYMLN